MVRAGTGIFIDVCIPTLSLVPAQNAKERAREKEKTLIEFINI
jgi:hypothetical protein